MIHTRTFSLAALLLVTVFFGFGCSKEPDVPLEFHEVALTKIGFVAQIPKTWTEDSHTADPNGPADYHEFIVPPHKKGEDKVAGTLGFRLVPRLAKNTLEDEVGSLKPFIKDAAGSEGVFSPDQPTRIGQYDAVQLQWHGVTKNAVEELWRYTVAFVGDDVLVVYFFDENNDAQQYNAAYENVLRTVEKR